MDSKQSFGDNEKLKGSDGTDLALNGSQQTVDWHYCSRCDQTIQLNEKDEHEDWHFAKDLQAQEPAGAVAPENPVQPTPLPQRSDVKQAGDSNRDQPPEHAPPSYAPPSYAPPSHPPPSNGASRATVSHQHTNPVIEAAKIRARDEVHFVSHLRDNCHID